MKRGSRLVLGFYNAVLVAFAPLLLIKKAIKFGRLGNSHEWDLARWNAPQSWNKPHKRVVFVALSWGEVEILNQLSQRLESHFSHLEIVWSIRDRDAQKMVKERFPTRKVVPMPFDFALPTQSWIQSVAPDVLIIVEKFWWPNLIQRAKMRGAKIVLVNGRSRGRQKMRYRLMSGFQRWILSAFDVLLFESDSQIERVRDVLPRGAKVVATGNIKFAFEAPIETNSTKNEAYSTKNQEVATAEANPTKNEAKLTTGEANSTKNEEAITITSNSTTVELNSTKNEANLKIAKANSTTVEANNSKSLRNWLDLRARDESGLLPLLIAGSTSQIDEKWALDAFEKVRAEIPCALLMAPRRIARADEIAAQIETSGDAVSRRSAPVEDAQILILDTLGELFHAYQFGIAAYVGGAVDGRGHNIIEPLAQGIAVSYGPNRGDFEGAQRAAEEWNVGFRLQNSDELADFYKKSLRDAEFRREIAVNAEQLIEAQRGALDATVAAIETVMRSNP